jgi:hypothetical protein
VREERKNFDKSAEIPFGCLREKFHPPAELNSTNVASTIQRSGAAKMIKSFKDPET